MKKLYFLVVILFVVGSVRGQVINFPDPYFKATLLSSGVAQNLSGQNILIDTNNNSEIEESEALQVGTLWLANKDFIDATGLTYFTNLKKLYCQFVDLAALDISTLVNLEYLDCSYNNIATLDLSNLSNLKEIFCHYNDLTVLNTSSLANLKLLHCDDNQLTSIDISASANIEFFSAGNNQFTDLNFDGFEYLESLYVNNNNLHAISIEGCTSLKDLSLGGNPLLQELDVSSCSALQSIGIANIAIQSLDLSGLTELVSIEMTHGVLESLNVDGCTSLEYLWASNNHLSTIDVSSATALQLLDVKNNYLESIFIKNAATTSIAIDGNFPLKYICTDDFLISDYEVMVSLATPPFYFDVIVNSYCSFIPGGIFYNIDGTTTIDSDNNGCDIDDLNIFNLKFGITNDEVSGSFIADETGFYSIPVQAGAHTITPILENPTLFTVTPETIEVTFPETTSPFTQNFCITPNGLHPDLEVVILPTDPARPGFDANYKLVIKNKGNIQQSGSVTFSYNDSVLDYVIASPVFTTQTTGSLSWDFANLEPFETREISVTLNLNSPMETPAVNGDDVLNYTATITSDQVDDLPLDNTFTLRQIVVNSFDPNDKTCLEGTSITPDMIGKYVHYMIRFENTGTFAAQNIVVKDMIDTAKFDVSSLVTLTGSHAYVTRITGNKVEFIFENINLPFDDANNDGYVVFKIKTLPTLALGDSFSNSASIYFDYNHPIITEPAVTTFAELGTEDFVFNNYFTLYPNPTTGILNITSKQAIEMQSISIYNVLGQMVVSVPNAKGIANIDVSSLSTGNYFIKIVSDKGTSNAKFIKQ